MSCCVNDSEKEAYKIVLKDLCKCGLFRGRYDALNGDEHYMYGVSSVMESIAYHVSDEVGDDFSDKFIKNMLRSEERAERRRKCLARKKCLMRWERVTGTTNSLIEVLTKLFGKSTRQW